MSKKNKIEIVKSDIGYENKNTGKILLSNLNITAKTGELIALVGVNGSGKSTLLRSLANIQKLLSGNIFIDQNNLHSFSTLEIAKKISFVSSEIINIRFLKVTDLVGLGRYPHQKFSTKYTENDKLIIDNALKRTGMRKLEDKYINEISDGERQKAMIARALAQDTDIILLDEPTAFLDISNKFEVFSILSETCKRQNKTIIFSTHDLNIALKHADKVWLIKDKTILEGAPEDLMLDDNFSKIFSNEKVKFNHLTSSFEIQEEKKIPIKLINKSNSNKHYYLTVNALKREGFFINENTSDYILEITSEKTWSLLKYNQKYQFNSIYDLMNVLSIQTSKRS